MIESMNGCCVDKKSGSPRGCTPETCMDLPDGKTCADCRHVKHCVAMYDVKPENTWCDFHPRRFRLPMAPKSSGAEVAT
jgi:hypothetical protein